LCHEINEDSVGHQLLETGVVAVLSDGVGGKPGGAFASRLVVEGMLQGVGRGQADAERLRQAAAAANTALRAARADHEGYEEMAATVVALLATAGEAAVLHAGDSRCYRWRQGELRALTRDDTVAEQMVADGTISAADAGRSPYQHLLTRAMGIQPELTCSLACFPILSGDLYLLCSDGLNKAIGDSAIAAVLAAAGDDAVALERLLTAANAAGGPDNVSIILVRCEEAE
jgi:protein phosphatase